MKLFVQNAFDKIKIKIINVIKLNVILTII